MSALPAERYKYIHSATSQKSRCRHLEVQRLQDYLRRRCLRVRYQRRHHCQGHHAPFEKAQGGTRSGPQGGARRAEEEIEKVEEGQKGVISYPI